MQARVPAAWSSGFAIVFVACVAAGGGGTGEGFAGVGAMSVLAGGLASAGGVPQRQAPFPLRGVAGTPDEGVAMLGATGSGFAPGGGGDRSRRLSTPGGASPPGRWAMQRARPA